MDSQVRDPQVDFDFYEVDAVNGDIQLGWKRLHDGPDIFWTPRNGGHWVFTRADDIYTAYRDDDIFSSRHVAIPKEADRAMKFAPAEFDKPEHAKYRMAITPLFTPPQIKRMEGKARALSAELIEGFRPNGGCEFVSEFADRLPITIFLTMMDLPARDHAILAPHVEAIARSPDPEAIGTAFQTMIGYLGGKIAERETGGGEDALSRLLQSKIGDRPARRDEVLSLAANVMFAGLDTVLSGMAFLMRFLALNPAHRRRLVNEPKLIPDAIEEMLRRHGIANLARTVSRRTEFKGVILEAGDMVQLPTALHGLDERRFDDPIAVDFDRADKVHMVFAVGPHRCLGSHLARMELRVMLEEWLPRIPDFRLADSTKVVARSGRLNALKSLPLAW